MKKIILTQSNPNRVRILVAVLGMLLVAEVILKLTYFY